jgi:four helix bundle protein
MDFVIEIYKLTESFPRSEEFGLKPQLRRASVSVPSCIAEGLTRKTKADKLHFLNPDYS